MAYRCDECEKSKDNYDACYYKKLMRHGDYVTDCEGFEYKKPENEERQQGFI